MTSSGTSSVASYPFGSVDTLEPDPTCGHLREHEPVSRMRMPYGEEAWLVTRHEDAKLVLADPRFSRKVALDRDEPRLTPQSAVPPESIMAKDPPEHTRLRRLVAQAFTFRRVQRLRPRVEQIAGELVDRMLQAGPPAEFVSAYALPLPLTVICELLGVPEADRQHMHGWTEAFLFTAPLSPEERRRRMEEFGQYTTKLIDQRRAEPRDDLISALVQAHDGQDRLSYGELVRLSSGLVAAGHETLLTETTNILYFLLTRPDLLRQVHDQPEVIPTAVEELLRHVPFGEVLPIARYATEDVQLGGVTVRAGEPVVVSLSAVNHDPRAFADPERVDLARSPNPHLALGHGPHHCLGAQLARMELEVTLATVIPRMPGLALAVPPEQLRWQTKSVMRGLLELPITWQA